MNHEFCHEPTTYDGPAHRVLLVGEPGTLAETIEKMISRAGHEIVRVGADDENLFEHAMARDIVVYLPAVDLARAESRPDGERIVAILRATDAAGVGLFVLVVPDSDYAFEKDALERQGIPYFVLEVAPGGAPHLPEAVVRALDDERVGRTIQVVGEHIRPTPTPNTAHWAVRALALAGTPLALLAMASFGAAALVVLVLSFAFAWPLAMLAFVIGVVGVTVRAWASDRTKDDERRPPAVPSSSGGLGVAPA